MEKESHLWENLAEQPVPLQLARQVLQPLSFTSEFSAYDAIPNSLEAIHQYAANMVLQHWIKQESPRAMVIMPEHTGLPQVGLEVLKAMLRLQMTVRLVVVIADFPEDALNTWSDAPIDGLDVFCIGDRKDYRGPWRKWKESRSGHLQFSSDLAELVDFLKGTSRHKVMILCARKHTRCYYDHIKSALQEAKDLTLDLMIDSNCLSTAFNRLSTPFLRNLYDDDYLLVRHRVSLSSSALSCQWESKSTPRFGGMYSTTGKSLNCGPVAFHLPRSGAVQRGLLRPVKLWPWTVANLNRGKNFRARDPRHQAQAIVSFQQRHPARSMYAFLPKIENAQELHAELHALSPQTRGKVQSIYISADMNTSDRYAYSKLLAANEPVVVSSVNVLLENRSTPPVEAAFVSPGKISSLHLGKMIGLVSKLSDQTSYDYGSVLVLRDKTRASEVTLALVLAALVGEDPLMINSLKQLVLLCVALDKDLPSNEWPSEIRDLVCDDCTIPRHVLAEALQIAGASR